MVTSCFTLSWCHKNPELLLLGDLYIHQCKRHTLKFLWGLQECINLLYLCSFTEVEEPLVQASLCCCVLYWCGQRCLTEQYHNF